MNHHTEMPMSAHKKNMTEEAFAIAFANRQFCGPLGRKNGRTERFRIHKERMASKRWIRDGAM